MCNRKSEYYQITEIKSEIIEGEKIAFYHVFLLCTECVGKVIVSRVEMPHYNKPILSEIRARAIEFYGCS